MRMKTRSFVLSFVLMIVLLLGFGFRPSWAQSENEQAAVSAAQAWLSLIDGGNASGSWKEASIYFRGAVTEARWVASLEGGRKPLGRPVSRKVAGTQETASFRGAPDGRDVVISFETAFENKQSAFETITFMLDNDGKWRAAGYFIR